MSFGGILSIVGLILFITRSNDENGAVKLLGAELKGPAQLILVLIGVVVFILPITNPKPFEIKKFEKTEVDESTSKVTEREVQTDNKTGLEISSPKESPDQATQTTDASKIESESKKEEVSVDIRPYFRILSGVNEDILENKENVDEESIFIYDSLEEYGVGLEGEEHINLCGNEYLSSYSLEYSSDYRESATTVFLQVVFCIDGNLTFEWAEYCFRNGNGDPTELENDQVAPTGTWYIENKNLIINVEALNNNYKFSFDWDKIVGMLERKEYDKKTLFEKFACPLRQMEVIYGNNLFPKSDKSAVSMADVWPG